MKDEFVVAYCRDTHPLSLTQCIKLNRPATQSVTQRVDRWDKRLKNVL